MIIGICGNKFSGKDTIGNYLVENYQYKRFAFADSLKDICKILFDFNNEQLYGNEKEILDEYWLKTPRELFQTIGTDLFRNNFSEDFWIKVLEKKLIQELKNNPFQKIVITDVRFPNEADMIKRLDGKIFKVNRNENSDLHESENYIDLINADINIINNGTKEELYYKVNSIFPTKENNISSPIIYWLVKICGDRFLSTHSLNVINLSRLETLKSISSGKCFDYNNIRYVYNNEICLHFSIFQNIENFDLMELDFYKDFCNDEVIEMIKMRKENSEKKIS